MKRCRRVEVLESQGDKNPNSAGTKLGPGRSKAGGGQRDKVAGPYMAPVVPKNLVSGRSTRGQRPPRGQPQAQQQQGDSNDSDEELNQEELAKLAGLLAASGNEEEAAQGSSMLSNIDALYTQLLEKQGVQPARADAEDFEMEHQEDVGSDPQYPSATGGYPGSVQAAPMPEQPASTEIPEVDIQVEEDHGGEELLANIDKLYGEMLQGGRAPHREDYAAEAPVSPKKASEPAQSPRSAVKPGEAFGDQAAEEDEEADGETEESAAAELPTMLEEVLWSALLLARGAAGSKRSSSAGKAAQAQLFEHLPPSELAEACRRCKEGQPAASLLQRLATELPEAHAAAMLGKASEGKQVAASRLKTVKLLRSVRKARDALLSAAASPRPNSEAGGETSRPTSASGKSAKSGGAPTRARAKSKPRRSGMSYWTDDSLDALQVENCKRTVKAVR